VSGARELPWGEGDRLLRFRAERGAGASELFGPLPRDAAELARAVRSRPLPDPERRRRALAALRTEWASLDLPPAASAAAARLDDPRTRIVIAGQQPALWGGPLLLAVKALAAIRAAQELEAAGVPAVALFWIASEDHDVKELRGGVVTPRSGPPVPLDSPFEPGRRMLGRLSHRLDRATRLAAIEPILAAGPHGARWRPRLGRILADDPATEFQNLWIELFGARGLLPVRPEWLRELGRPVIEAELARPGELARHARKSIARLESFGLPVPIPEPAELPFFRIDDAGDRHRLHLEGGSVRIGGRDGERCALEALAGELARAPERFSPDALLRPLLADSILEPAASVLGPTELAYHLELTDAYAPRGIPRPILLPRPRLRIVDGEDARTLDRLGLDPGALSPGDTAASRLPSPEAARRRAELARLAGPLLAAIEGWAEEAGLDAALRKRCDRLGRRLREDFVKLDDALGRGAGGDVAEERRELARILARIFPLGEEGERSASLLGFLVEHGEAGLDAIHGAAEPGEGRLRLLVLAPEREVCRDAP